MNSPSGDASVPADVQLRIEVRCNEFRKAWIEGKSPSLIDFIDPSSNEGRPHLIRALLEVELEQRGEAGVETLTPQELIELHPGISVDLARAFREIESSGTPRGTGSQHTLPAAPEAEVGERTIEHTPSRNKDSRGLHIRCPHCSNAVQLVTDTPYEEICCSSCGSMFSLVDRDESTRMAAPLKTIGRFDLIARLGVGGFGTVWKARDRELDRVVAIKIPRRGQLAPHEVDQFFREARTAAQLRHHNIVPIHEVGRDGDTLFIVSDFVRGVTLSDWLTGHRPNTLEIIDLCVPIACALHHAHEHGVVHRDLKPPNILIDEQCYPYITDFGLAKRELGEITMTVDGQILGTPRYMSPEQASGHGHWTDRRTDIYSFGVILFELLTGELPFRGSAQMQIHQRLTEDAPDPRKLNRHIPRDLATICLKCLEREPGRRYSTAAAVADELERYRRGEPIDARPISSPARLARWARRKPMVATTAALTIFLAIAGPIIALMIDRQRARLQELVIEKNNLIDRKAVETRRAANEITELKSRLDVWEGRANPWAFWPPSRDEPPRKNLIASLRTHSTATLATLLRDGKFNSLETARGYLALAILSDAVGQDADAQQNYERARDLLLALREQKPNEPQISRALAESYAQLARLATNKNREAAADDLNRAAAIHKQLAAEHRSDKRHPIALLETELDSATIAGFASGQANLARVAELNRALSGNWPSEPDAIYRLACYLTQQEAILSTTPEAIEGENAPEFTSRITDPTD
jgi:serine/threonine protein kinase/ribosomal protein S27E